MSKSRAARAPAAATPEAASGYEGLLRAAEAHPDEFFTIAGEKLAALLRDLEASRLSGRSRGPRKGRSFRRPAASRR